jgi:hypothetical protein
MDKFQVHNSVVDSDLTKACLLAEPYSQYEIWVRAFTSKHEGKPNEPSAAVWTDVRPPGRPDIVSLVCQSGTTMFLKWVRPTEFYRTVDVYYVLYRSRKESQETGGRREGQGAGSRREGQEVDWEEQVVETVNNTINHMVRFSFCFSRICVFLTSQSSCSSLYLYYYYFFT